MSVRISIAAMLACLPACTPDAKDLAWTVGFATVALETESAHVTAWIVRGGCNGNERVYETDVQSEPGERPSESLRPGVYGFGATATDAACARVAEACVERKVPDDVDSPIDLELSESRGSAACDASMCQAGVCGQPGPMSDASLADASQPPDAAQPPDASQPDAAVDTCPDGVRRPSGACYRYHDVTTTFAGARDLCAQWSADLTVFGDANEESWVVANLGPSGDFWLGITDAAVEGTWLTVQATPAMFFRWDTNPQNPDGGTNSNCARYNAGTAMWRDLSCTGTIRVICERP